MPDQTWAGGGGGGAPPLQNGHAQIHQVPPPNNWNPQLPSPGASYPPQYGSPPMAQWSQPYPAKPTPPAAPAPPPQQWTTYASPPPPSNTFYPANATTSYLIPAHQSEQPQFSQKVYAPAAGQYAPAPPTGAPTHGVTTPPSYPTQYPNIPKAQYNAAPTPEFFNGMGAPAGGGMTTPPMVGYPPRLFTPQQQPVTSSQSYHPYRRQP